MKRIFLLALLIPILGFGKTYIRSYTRKTSSYSVRAYRRDRALSYIPRDSRGKIARSVTAKDAFKRQQPCPTNGRTYGPCPGYNVDHIKPLACGGLDTPSNMQWLSIKEHHLKSEHDRDNCK
jgi:hypothetical protein